MAGIVPLNRDELARFLPDRKSVLAFEANFQNVSDNTDAVTNAQTTAENAQAAAVAAQDTADTAQIAANTAQSAADFAQASADAAQSTADAAAPQTTQILAGDGLTGGGDLSANRTLNVGAGTGITVNPDDIALTVPTASGTYTPTISNQSNLDSAAMLGNCNYMRVGNMVTVSGIVTVDPTASGFVTSLEMTLPIASNLGAAADVSGTACAGGIVQTGFIISSIANDHAQLNFVSTTTASENMAFTYLYEII